MKIFSTFLVLCILISSCTWLKEHEYEDNNRRTLDFDREYRSRSTSQKYSNGAGAPESGMPSEPGKCYAKCLIQDLYELDSTYIYEYTGVTPSEVSGVEYQTLKTAPASTKWVKKKADKNCNSANPHDCLIWCLVDVDEQTECRDKKCFSSISKG